MTGDYSSEISSIINALTGKFARKDHSHSGGGGTITDEEWSNPTWNESYINVTTSTHLRLFRMGNLCTLKYYFSTKTGGDIPTTNVNIVTNIPTAFQPKYSPHQEALLNTSGKRFLMTLDGSNLKVLTYESSAMAGTFTGSISYECKGDGVVPLLTCSANATAYVGDSLTISGVLSYNNTGIASASVKLYDGSTLVDTLTSDSSGAVSKTVTATEGTHSYKLVFEGDATYSNAESSSVSVVVSKRTPTISLSASSSSIYVGDTPSISGTLSVGSGASVKIYSGSTLLDTVTTGTNGAFSYTGSATSTSGSISYKAVYDGDSAYESVESSSVTITVSKKTPTLSANASTSTPAINSSFTISGTLKDGSANINGASITISLNGSTVATTTTSSGAFSATITAPSSTGSYTYAIAYGGDNKYVGVGETVSVTVNKISTTTTLATSSATVSVGDTFTLSGTFQAGSTSLSGYTVEIYETNEGLIDEVTTNSGSFSTTVSASDLGTGSFSFYAIAYGDNTYEGSTSSDVSVVITSAPTVASVSLTGDKSIISAYDQESCTLTATVLDSSNNPVSGATVSFDIVSGGSVVSNIDTATTNSSGIATVSYSGNHAGDLNIQASCGIILSEIYAIEDCWRYDDAVTDKHSAYSTFLSNPTNAYVTYDSTYKEYKLNYSRTPESNPLRLLLQELTVSDFEASIDIYYTGSLTRQWTFRLEKNITDYWNNHSECGTWTSSKILRNVANGTQSQVNPSGAMPSGTWIRCKFRRQNGTISIQATNTSNGSSIASYSSNAYNDTDIRVVLQVSEYFNSLVFKNLKIKSL